LFAAFDGGDASAGIDAALETVGPEGRAGDKVGGYSQGMRQRLGLAVSLLRQPRLLILDEPTNGLDPGGIRDMRDLIKEACRARDDDLSLQSSAGRGRGALYARGRDPFGPHRLRGPARLAPTDRVRHHSDNRRRPEPRRALISLGNPPEVRKRSAQGVFICAARPR
jgi:hypothetical protein